jgi:hypothetical protein
MRDAAVQPYVGPRQFDSGEQALFFGRDREADDLLGLIMFHRVVLLYAQSGAGKSSLINTRVVPGLRASGFRVLPVARVRGAGTPDAGVHIANVYVYNALNAMLASGLGDAGDDLASLDLKGALARVPMAAGEQGLVLIFDQFEELFTSHQDRWVEREAFFTQVAEALAAFNSVRIVFSMREDFIAEIDPLVWRLPDGIDARYRLELLRRDAAVEAVTGPPRLAGVTFERVAAEKLVGQLLEVNVEGPGGRPQRVQGEYVEPVQLQIVCRRLWERLPLDVDAITEAHLEQFGDVADALGAFYGNAVEEAARTAHYPQKLIHLGCTQFVTSSGTRSMVHRDRQVTGLLPNAVVDSLVDQHLLRAEIRAGARWYEISHDRLVEPILHKKLNDEELKTLLRTSELLVAAVEQWDARRDFVSDRHILSAIAEVKNDLRLSERELEFLGMNALGAGFEMEAWVARLQADAPEVLARLLALACDHPRAEVRRNAAVALGHGNLGPPQDVLPRLATDDPDLEVREAAAASLARIDRADLNARMLALLRDAGERPRARAALARIRNESVIRERAVDFERRWALLPFFDRARLALALARVRLEKAWPTLVYVGLFGGIGAAIGCGVPRMVPTIWALTLTDAGVPRWSLALSGLYQGGAGGIVWGSAVGLFLALGWVLFRRHGEGIVNRRNASNLILGILGGIVGGFGVFAVIFFVFDTDVLIRIGWLPPGSPHHLQPCLTDTGYCLFHPVLGIPFGAGAAIAISALHTLPHWQRFIEPHVRRGRIVHWRATLWQILRLSTIFSVPTVVLLYAFAIPMMFWLRAGFAKTVFETATILTGNIGGVAGIMFGQLIMRVGITIPARAD